MHPIITEDLETIAKGISEEAPRLEGKTLLISGGSGFLGTYFLGVINHLNKHQFQRHCRVISIDNYITGSRARFIAPLDEAYITTVHGDIREPLCIEGPVDFIIHAAGLASPVYYRKYPLETIEAAVVGAKNLLELACEKKPKSFLFFSSSEIYGDPHSDAIPTPETYRGNVSNTGPRACYDESKRLAETMCTVYNQVHGVPVKIVRPFNVYGPGMKADDYRVIPAFFSKGLSGEPLAVHDKGLQTRTFCYITDAITGFLKVLLRGQDGEAYNIGRDKEEVSMSALAATVARLFEKPVSVQLVSYPENYPADEPQRRCPDLTKARSELHFSPQVDLATGLRRSLAWFRDAYPPQEKAFEI